MTNAFESISHQYYVPYDNSKGGSSSLYSHTVLPQNLFFLLLLFGNLEKKTKKNQEDLISPAQVIDCSKTNAVSGGRWDIFSENKPLNKGQPCFPNTSNPFTEIEACGQLQNHAKKM